MPEILLMRHAKSEHPAGVRDRDRPLSGRGHRAASAVGAAITGFGAAPTAILSSPALRARTTAELARSAGGWTAPIQIVDELYGGGVDAVLAQLAGVEGTTLVVGHEPTWSMTVSHLIGGGTIGMVTAAVACLESSGPPRPGGCALRWMIHPRLLG